MYKLNKNLIAFPQHQYATEDGLLAYGGDLNPDRLLYAYRNGIFPWYNEPPILWWSPDPRFVIFIDKFKIPRSLRKVINKQNYEIKINSNFSEVINNCSKIGSSRVRGTWITSDMIEAYNNLHSLGFAHSVEVYRDNRLIGGLYGVSSGKVFSGESMFSTESNSGKIAVYYLIKYLKNNNYYLLDCQQESCLFLKFGGENISRADFLQILSGKNFI
jgi:leucyl/phenylalanyl-tRNA---protein transferase